MRFDWFCVFLLVFEKGFKGKKAKWQKWICVFFNIKGNGLMIELKLTWNLVKKETKMNDHSIESRGLLWKSFVNFWLFECFCYFWIIKLTERKGKKRKDLMLALDHHKDLLPKLPSIKGKHTPTHAHMHLNYYKKPINTFYGLR